MLKCWAGRHTGICSHIVAVNAFEGKVDLAAWLTPLDEGKEAGCPKTLHYLYKSGPTLEDSAPTAQPSVSLRQ